MNDKKKIALLYTVIIFLIIMISGLVFIVYLSDKDENKGEENRVSNTTRRTMKQTSEVSSNTTIPLIPEETTTTTITTTTTTTKGTTTKNNNNNNSNNSSNSSNNKTTTSKTTTKKKTTTSKTTTTKKVSSSSSSVIPIREYETTTSNSTYPNALNNVEWEIVNKINDARRKNGLNTLGVAGYLRNLAEEAADYMYDFSSSEVASYLNGYSHYRKWTNYTINGSVSDYFYNTTISNINITSNPSLKYIGVGLIYREIGTGSLPSYYYVIIYE